MAAKTKKAADKKRQDYCRHADSRRRHRPRGHGGHPRGARGRRRTVRIRMAHGGRGGPEEGGRSPAQGHDREHPQDAARAEGPARHTGGRRLSLLQRAPARGVPPLRQPAPRAHAGSRRALREHRPRAGAREPRRPLRGLRALHPRRRRSARGGARLGREHARGRAAHLRVRLRLRGEERPQEGHAGAQGERAQGAHRASSSRPGARWPSATRARGSPATNGSSTPARCSS